jgi:hypothetical protein
MRLATILSGLVLAVLPVAAQAETLGFTHDGIDQVDAFALKVKYTYVSPALGQLKISNAASGFTVVVNDNGVAKRYGGGSYLLTADINPMTGTATAGSIKVTVPIAGVQQIIWNSALLTDFGASSNLRDLDFQFIQQGPSIFSAIEDQQAFGISVFATAGFPAAGATWNADFAYTAKNDGTPLVPLPPAASIGLVMFGLVGARKLKVWFGKGVPAA